MANDRFDLDVDRVVQKVYHTDELKEIMEDITTDFIYQVVLMSDEEFNEDRSVWIKMYGWGDELDEFINPESNEFGFYYQTKTELFGTSRYELITAARWDKHDLLDEGVLFGCFL